PSSIPNSKFSNFVNDHGMDMTSGVNTIFGSLDRLYVEESADPTEQHSIARSAKSLAAYYAMQLLDPSLKWEAILGAMKSASNQSSNTLESVASTLGYFQGSSVPSDEDGL